MNNRNRFENVSRSIIWQMYTLFITSVFPFVIRTVMIKTLGMEYTGVSSLFASVLQVMSVADLGIDTAASFYLYEPIAKQDRKKVCAILNLFRKSYRFIGLAVFLLGIIGFPVIPYLVKGKMYPESLNIYIIYIIYVVNSLLTYFCGGYWSSILIANQQRDVIYKIGGTSALAMYLFQLYSLIVLKNYYVFTFFMLANTFVILILTKRYANRKYPFYKCSGSLDSLFMQDFKKRIVALTLAKIRNVSRNSFDSIVISSFLGLTLLAKYQNYYQILLIAILFIGIITASIVPSLGNKMVLDSPSDNYEILIQITMVINFVVTIISSLLINAYQPLIEIWVGQKCQLSMWIVFLMISYLYVISISNIATMLRDSSGIWWEGKFGAVIEAVANLCLNVLLVRWLGVYGVILASVVTVLFINIPWEFYYIFKYYFRYGIKKYLIIQIKYTFLSLITIITSYACGKMFRSDNAWKNIGVSIIICLSSCVIWIILFWHDRHLRRIIKRVCKTMLIHK